MTKLQAELVFLPWQGMGHITPMVELAKRLLHRDPRISITIFILNTPTLQNNASYLNFLSPNTNRIRLLSLPEIDNPLNNTFRGLQHMIGQYKPIVKQAVEEHVILGSGHSSSASTRPLLAGFVLDFFCTPIMPVADELGVPAYIFYASNASLLSLVLHFQHLRDDHGVDPTEFTDPDTELDLPGFKDRVPCKVLPSRLLEKGDGGSYTMLNHARGYRGARGILINTFEEVDSYALRSLSDDANVPRVYPVGPMIKVDPPVKEDDPNPIIGWLEDQPPASVVFLCFGSLGSFGEDQVMEIAKALESSGQRFLWSLRRPAGPEEKSGPARDYDDVSAVLTDGFLQRTASRGRVIGWAPQVAVLSHAAVGAFVSHCGWNSILESLWFGVPIAAWPMYAEQQINAFRMVREMGLAVEIRVDYRRDPRTKMGNGLVGAEVVEEGIRKVMDMESGLRGKVTVMGNACREATKDGGTSNVWLGRFVDDVFEAAENFDLDTVSS